MTRIPETVKEFALIENGETVLLVEVDAPNARKWIERKLAEMKIQNPNHQYEIVTQTNRSGLGWGE